MAAEPTRQRGHISWSSVEGRLLATRSMILVTVRPDRRPHALPVWFWWDGAGHIYFTTSRGSQKQRNLARQMWAIAHFGNGDDVLFVDGPVHVVSDVEEQRRVDSGYRAKYVDPKSGEGWSIFNNTKDDLYRIDVDRFVTWMYGNAGGRTEWRPG